MSDLVAVMSHELRTPLNAIFGYTDLLLLGIPVLIHEPLRAHAGRIETSSRHLLLIIEQILAFSRLEAGREQVLAEAVEVGTLLRESAALVQPLAAQKSLALVLELPDEPLRLSTDPGKLRQIVLNLLSNALK